MKKKTDPLVALLAYAIGVLVIVVFWWGAMLACDARDAGQRIREPHGQR